MISKALSHDFQAFHISFPQWAPGPVRKKHWGLPNAPTNSPGRGDCEWRRTGLERKSAISLRRTARWDWWIYLSIYIYTYLPVLIYQKHQQNITSIVIAVIIINTNSFINVTTYAVLLCTMCIFTYVFKMYIRGSQKLGTPQWDPGNYPPFQLEDLWIMFIFYSKQTFKKWQTLMSAATCFGSESLYLTRSNKLLCWGISMASLGFFEGSFKISSSLRHVFSLIIQMFGVTTAMSGLSPSPTGPQKVWMVQEAM